MTGLSMTVTQRATCPVCLKNSGTYLGAKKGYSLYRCAVCATDFVSPVPEEEILEKMYDNPAWFGGSENGGYQDYDLQTKNVLPLFRDVLSELEGGAANRTLLDVGCGFGIHLSLAANDGWRCAGVEPSDYARKIMEDRHGCAIPVVKRISEIVGGPFDIILLLDVIEHVSDPYRLFQELTRRGAIGPETRFAITTPNARSRSALFDPLGWVHRTPPAHLVYYSPESFRVLFSHMQYSGLVVTGIYPQQSSSESFRYADENFWVNDVMSTGEGLLCIATVGATGATAAMHGKDQRELDGHERELVETQRCGDRICYELVEQDEVTRMRSTFRIGNWQQMLSSEWLVESLRGEVQGRDTQLEQLAQTIEQLQTERKLKGARVEQLEKQLQVGQIKSEELARQVDALRAELDGKTRELQAHRSSRLYRFATTWRSEPWSVRKLSELLQLLLAATMPAAAKSACRKVASVFAARSANAQRSEIVAPAPYYVTQPFVQQSSRPRVLHAIANFMTGGSSRLVVDLIEHLGDRFEQEVITSYIPSPPAYAGLEIHECKQGNLLNQIADQLGRFRPALVHIHYWGDCDERWYRTVFAAAERFGCKIIENINTPVSPYRSEAIARYVYVSQYVCSTFGSGDARETIIYPGSDFRRFARQAETMPDDCVGMVYRLEPDKLSEQSIDVFIKVVARRPGTKVRIVGGGSYLSLFKKAADKAGFGDAFHFTGYVSYDELPRIYQELSVFVAPVWKESFGQVSPFAMNMGIPVVGYAVGAIPEIVADPDLVAPPGDSDRLADIVISLLEDRERRLEIGRRNAARARSLYSVEAMIDRYRDTYDEVLGVRA